MPHITPQLPKEIYHRLYWYAKRNVDPIRVATAMGLPLNTVNHFINRFKAEKNFSPSANPPADARKHKISEAQTDFLDIFIFSKTRYSIIDISGSIDNKNAGKLKETLIKTKSSHRNPIALKMTDVMNIDKIGAEIILSLYLDFKQSGRYIAILDPSTVVEPALKQYGVETMVPIFGTEIAFEEHAFR